MNYLTFLLLAFYAFYVKGQTEGAIDQPDPNSPCTVCFNVNETAKTTDLSPWFRGETNMTCSDIVSTVDNSGLLQGNDQCKDMQLMAFQLGCCSTPPYEYCSVCPDGSDFVRSDVVPIGDSQRADPTCAENLYRIASYIPLFTPGTCSDTVIQRGDFYCGCPNAEQRCYLCPDEQPPTNPERGDAWITNSNCQGIQFLFSLYNEQECVDYRENYGVDYANFCKCPGYVMNSTGTCLMCEGGLANPDFTYTSESDPFTRTCQQAQDFAESIFRENICLREMNDVISKGCECKDGTGSIFKTEDSSSSWATTNTIQFAAGTMMTLLVHALLA